MNKQEFFVRLREGLAGLPKADLEERLAFYSEIIDDKIEEGSSEEEAVREVGTVEEIISQILAETPFATLVKEKIKRNRRLKAWEIVLLVLGSPIWFSLLVAAVAVMISVYAAIWSVIVAFWSVAVSLAAGAVGGVLAAGIFVYQGNGITGVAVLGAGFVCAGLSIFMYFGCKAATKGILILTKKFFIWLKNCFIKGDA